MDTGFYDQSTTDDGRVVLWTEILHAATIEADFRGCVYCCCERCERRGWVSQQG